MFVIDHDEPIRITSSLRKCSNHGGGLIPPWQQAWQKACAPLNFQNCSDAAVPTRADERSRAAGRMFWLTRNRFLRIVAPP